jgi:hypothetical protein
MNLILIRSFVLLQRVFSLSFQEVTWQTVLNCVFGPLWRVELSSRLGDFRRCPVHPLVNGEHFQIVTINFRNSSSLNVSSCGSCSQQGFRALGFSGASPYLLLFLSADSKSLLLALWQSKHLELALHLSQCIMPSGWCKTFAWRRVSCLYKH